MINVVGIGLDGIAGLNEKIQKLVDKATFLVGSERHLSYFSHHPAQRLLLGNLQKILEVIQQKQEQEEIIILVSGDPLFFGLGRLLLTKLSPNNLAFYPHYTSLQLAFNKIKMPWQDAEIVSVHGRNLEQLIPLLRQGKKKIAILTDHTNNPGAIANLYLSLDIPTNYDFWVCENLGDETEKLSYFNYENINDLLKQNFSCLNVVILLRQENFKDNYLDINDLPILGLSDHTFSSFDDRPGLMTKRETRLIILGELALQPQQVVWDIGAGTGSVSLEIARLSPTSQVYAIEKTAIGIHLIEQNCQKLQISNVIAINGKAPEILEKLPAPQRIFIGGSSGNLSSILDICEQKITKNGIIVLAIATLEHLHSSLTWLEQHNCNYHLLQVQISRSLPLANLTRFSPLNPVTIITVNRDLHNLIKSEK